MVLLPFFFEKIRIGFHQNEIIFFWHSVVECLTMDSSNWWTGSRQSNIILRKKRMYSLLFPKLTNAFSWIQKWISENRIRSRPLHWERILIRSDCVSKQLNNMKSSSWHYLSKTMTKTILFSLVSIWLGSWGLAADIETFVH